VQVRRIRPAWAEIDLDAVRHNAGLLAGQVNPAKLCAVVKAGGYGHGAVQVARAALSGGAEWLAVALVEEGIELRDAGIRAPVLLLSEPVPQAMAELVAAGLTPTIYTTDGLDALVSAARTRTDATRPYPLHIKVDTGMHRVGAAADEAVSLAVRAASTPGLRLEGFWTHLAVSDERDNTFTSEQIDRFDDARASLQGSGVAPAMLHAANSAAALWYPRSRFDMVRCGISLYGLASGASLTEVPPADGLRPAMSLKASVSFVKPVSAGERISYGLRYRAERDCMVATVPLGYADGVTRSLAAAGAEVLIGGARLRVAGTVTMDQLMVDCGAEDQVQPGDEVVLIGRQGDESISAWEWAERTGTIAYEVVCGISSRVPRVYLGGS
jgi:alanine racemase